MKLIVKEMPARQKFYQLVDAACYARLGCSMHDLPDFPYSDYYDDEIASHEEMVNAADMCIEDLVLELKNDCEGYWL